MLHASASKVNWSRVGNNIALILENFKNEIRMQPLWMLSIDVANGGLEGLNHKFISACFILIW